jgi:hypothetical protein
MKVAVPVAALWLAGCGPSPLVAPEPAVPANPVGYDDPSARAAGSADAQQGKDIAIGAEEDSYADTDPKTIETFRPVLAPYGEWREDETYGTVWTPSTAVVGADFQPYVTAGYWSYDNGYVWVSDYSWGWAPFHYGRWVYVNGYGWSWIPGRRYAGAWVVWQTGPAGYEYVGWAPAPPEWYWYHGTAVMLVYRPYPRYVYCPTHYMFDRRVHEHIAPMASTSTIAANMTTWQPQGAPLVPASPTVNGSDGRVLASPGVAGSAGASDRVLARPKVGPAPGPDPKGLGIAPDRVTAVPKDDRGLWQARQAAVPSSAPMPHVAARAPDRFTAARAPQFVGAQPPPAAAPRALEPVARSPQFVGVEPRPPRPPSYTAPPQVYQPPPSVSRSTVYDRPPAYAPPSTPAFTAPRPTPPSITHQPPRYNPPTPSYSPPPSFSRPSYSAPAPAPVVRSAPVQPSFSRPAPSPPPMVHAAPRPAAPVTASPRANGLRR